MQTKQTRIKEGEEILSQVRFEKESSWFEFGLTIGLIAFWCGVFYFFTH
jgi:hypothetical protein